MEQALRRELSGLVSWSTPKGGFFLWATFHEGIDTDVLLERAIARGVLYVPGSAFFVDAHSGADARLSFSAPSPERIDAGIATARGGGSRRDRAQGFGGSAGFGGSVGFASAIRRLRGAHPASEASGGLIGAILGLQRIRRLRTVVGLAGAGGLTRLKDASIAPFSIFRVTTSTVGASASGSA